ncbi:MAG: hypothetical protein U1D97_02885 [Desulfuromonadales bacterium]|nr:hypothetical protein [Desulfuromonadales bacterium]
MNMIQEWPPCQIFYLESLRTITNSAITSFERLIAQSEANEEMKLSQSHFLDEVQNIIQQGAAISRYFWPSRNKDGIKNRIFDSRARFLRDYFDVGDSSPLKDRRVRNAIEHFDERLDLYLQTPISGNFFPNYIGDKPKTDRVIYKFFRAFFTDTQEFEILGESFPIQPLIDEIFRINECVRLDLQNGGVMRKEATEEATESLIESIKK